MKSEQIEFHSMRLCGGLSLMLIPNREVQISMVDAKDILPDVIRSNDEFIEFIKDELHITIYRSGGMLFYHFVDVDAAKKNAQEIVHMLQCTTEE